MLVISGPIKKQNLSQQVMANQLMQKIMRKFREKLSKDWNDLFNDQHGHLKDFSTEDHIFPFTILTYF